MIEHIDAKKVVEVIGNNLIGVAHDSNNFQKLPDSFWGYFARGHDTKGTFGVIVTYSDFSVLFFFAHSSYILINSSTSFPSSE